LKSKQLEKDFIVALNGVTGLIGTAGALEMLSLVRNGHQL
jgi:hypothetical protein